VRLAWTLDVTRSTDEVPTFRNLAAIPDGDAEGEQATYAENRADKFSSPTTPSRLTALKTPRSSWMATRTDTKFNNLDMT
jgi:hypothetical protein